MILLTTIVKKIQEKEKRNIGYEIDARYLNKWIEKHPDCFPKYAVNNKHKIIFNTSLLRYEIHKSN